MAHLQRVLCVEDEEDIRLIAELALTTVGGLEVKMVARGSEAVAAAVAFGPDVILLDVMMPGMDGPATLEALRADERTAAIPVVFMTAKVQRHEVEGYLELGAVGVIPKPFDPMTLAQQVREACS